MNKFVECCHLCNSEHFELFETCEDLGYVLTYHMCTNCGLVFQSPRMSDEELTEFYASNYRKLTQGTEEPTEKDLRIQAGRARHLLQVTKAVVPNISRHLDIGSSSGALLNAFKKSYQCDSVGIEPGEAYRTRSRAKQFETYAHLAELDNTEKRSFDFVSMSHVLEHISDPILYLTELTKNCMTPEGYLIIEVPNIFGHRSVELSHLFLFSPKTLRQILTRSGLKVLRLFTHGNPRSPILNLYITAVAQIESDGRYPIKDNFSSRGVRSRRAIGMWLYKFLTRVLPGRTWKALPELDEIY